MCQHTPMNMQVSRCVPLSSAPTTNRNCVRLRASEMRLLVLVVIECSTASSGFAAGSSAGSLVSAPLASQPRPSATKTKAILFSCASIATGFSYSYITCFGFRDDLIFFFLAAVVLACQTIQSHIYSNGTERAVCWQTSPDPACMKTNAENVA